jgi:hypothetical protein
MRFTASFAVLRFERSTQKVKDARYIEAIVRVIDEMRLKFEGARALNDVWTIVEE